MPKEPFEYIKHILDECNYILSVSDDSLSYYNFLDDETLKRAIVRSLGIIGEATKKISMEFRLQHDKINWKNIAGLRDKLIHDYIGIDYTIVWDVVKNKIPELQIQITDILNDI